MPMPQIAGTNGGILGTIRARLLKDPNVGTACGRNRIRPYRVPGIDSSSGPDNAAGDDMYPLIILSKVGGRAMQESDGANFDDLIVQVSVYGEGEDPTEFFAEQVDGLLNRKKVDNRQNVPVYLQRVSAIALMPDPDRSTLSRDVYHCPLRYRAMSGTLNTNNVLPYP